MRVVIIGGTGHIGSFLTPRLFAAGHTVVCVCRGQKAPYQKSAVWRAISYAQMDRAAEETSGNFGERIAALKPDAVIDLTCYALESARQLVRSLRGRVEHLLHCGTIWVHGHSVEVPTTEEQLRAPFGEYGVRKAAIEAYLLHEARTTGLPATVLHPGHLVGPGWAPVNPAGNFNPQVFSSLLQGEPIELPNLGLETLHHAAMNRRSLALGESFHVVSAAALTLRGYAERVSSWSGQAAKINFVPWDVWKQSASEKDAKVTWDHIAHSPNCSIEKARTLLGYAPRYSSLEALREAVDWLIQNGTVRSALDEPAS
jgi:nucleoside-diphosphate-sugar epimerase